jgi:mono/diheme cytochrome c family protein
VEALKLVLFSLGVVGFFSWYSNYIPQIESHPPKRIALDAKLSGEEMIEAGERIFNGKGTCNICHAIGRPGNRGPDLAGIALRAAQRKSGLSAKQYLLESLLKPSAYLVKGYGALMPPMARILTPGEFMVSVAYLQSLGGEVDITPAEVRQALANLTPAGASSAAAGSASVAAAKAKAGDPERGKQIYMTSCAPCHGPDPAADGPVGPRIKGASLALIEARVLRGAYPPGYRPRRATKLMPPLPQLEAELSHLAVFLEQ